MIAGVAGHSVTESRERRELEDGEVRGTASWVGLGGDREVFDDELRVRLRPPEKRTSRSSGKIKILSPRWRLPDP
ncbi:hypothetical protein CDL15_Pgr023481 [Punica granatum]|nr:hypothetical protein CDL15_Pgr023481 [Punica granatum]